MKTYTVAYSYKTIIEKVGRVGIEAESEEEAREKANEMDVDGELRDLTRDKLWSDEKFEIFGVIEEETK